jgi:small GTP-binding protein
LIRNSNSIEVGNILEANFLYKIPVTGEGGVGKTTLLHYYSYGGFRADLEMTIGVEFFQKILNIYEKIYRVTFWDLGGSENQFKSLHVSYLEGAMGAIVMFDLTRLHTLQKVGKWTKLLRKQNGDIPILLVGGKYDLVEMEKEKITKINARAMKIKEQYDLFDYIITSSKIGYNIDHAFLTLFQKVRNHQVMKEIIERLNTV